MDEKPPQVHTSLSFQGRLGTAEPALGIQPAEEIWGPSVSRMVSLCVPPQSCRDQCPSKSHCKPLHIPVATEALAQLGIRQAVSISEETFGDAALTCRCLWNGWVSQPSPRHSSCFMPGFVYAVLLSCILTQHIPTCHCVLWLCAEHPDNLIPHLASAAPAIHLLKE